MNIVQLIHFTIYRQIFLDYSYPYLRSTHLNSLSFYCSSGSISHHSRLWMNSRRQSSLFMTYNFFAEKVTNEKNTTEEWGDIMMVCDRAGGSTQNAKDCLRSIMKRLGHPDPHVGLQACTVSALLSFIFKMSFVLSYL